MRKPIGNKRQRNKRNNVILFTYYYLFFRSGFLYPTIIKKKYLSGYTYLKERNDDFYGVAITNV